MQQVKALRDSLKLQRSQLTESYQQDMAAHITQIAISQAFFSQANHIAYYMPFHGEVSPLMIMHKGFEQGKKAYLPTLKSLEKSLVFMPYVQGAPLKENQYGIEEVPFHKERIVLPEELDLVFIPLVAFDLQGQRIGMGAGFYDRTFSFKQQSARKPILCGLAYEFQNSKTLFTADPWDIPMDYVITEKCLYQFTA